MADVLDIDNAEEFEVDEEGDREYLLMLHQVVSTITLKFCFFFPIFAEISHFEK